MKPPCKVILIWLCSSLGTLEPILSLSFTASDVDKPSPSSRASLQPNVIKRVCIVGAGIAGLSLAHGLTNSPSLMQESKTALEGGGLEVSVFDSRALLDYTAGSGVQLNGGLACLGWINLDVQKAVIDAAIPLESIRGRHKSWQSDGSPVSRLWDYTLDDVFKDAGEEIQDLMDEDGNKLWYAIMRGALQETLLDLLPKRPGVQVEFGKTLTKIIAVEDGSRGALCKFSDGSTAGPFDLIVGCDGIKSAVKEYVETGKISDDRSKREGNAAAIYSGIRINFAVQEQETMSNSKEAACSLQQIFADGAYALTGTYGNGKGRPACDCVFVTSLDDAYNGPFKINSQSDTQADRSSDDPVLSSSSIEPSENADWTQNVLKPKDETREKMQKQINRYGVYDEDIKRTIANSDRFFELGVYFHNPLSLSGWSKEIPSSRGCYAVLCGDAAHAMPPFLGQGANQAIQDACSLAQRIHNFNTKLERVQDDPSNVRRLTDGDNDQNVDNIPNLKSILKEYERVRWSPTALITTKAAVLGYLETGGKAGYFAKFRDVLFKVLAFAGIPKKVLIDSATPRV